MVFSLIASYLGEKERILNFVHVVLIFTGLGQDLTLLFHKENTHNEIFLQAKKFNCILFSYGSLFSLAHSPNTLKEAKVPQS
jgi:hypothetical protein